ncbi:MAG: prolipoprotein diacylglyceryl transferase family protein, partial [Planctomycetota bacterium]
CPKSDCLKAGFVGQGIGRVGCLLVGDDHGSIVPEGSENLPFPITLKVPEGRDLHPESLFDPSVIGETIWATQPWMTINALLIAGIGYLILRKRRYAGQVSLWIFFLYSITRYAIESFRGDAVRGMWFGDTISTSQLIAIVTGLISAALLFRLRQKKDESFNMQSA